MSEWMTRYEHLIKKPVGTTVADMVNAMTNPLLDPVRAIRESDVKAQVYLLERLHEAGMLEEEPSTLLLYRVGESNW